MSGFYNLINIKNMLIGEFSAKLQDKNRTSLPKKFRSETGDKLIISKGYEDCLLVIPFSKWDLMIKDITNKPFTIGSARDTARFILGSAQEVSLDDQGRFVIPQSLVHHAELNEDISFIGLINWVEIWNEARWKERENFLRTNSSNIADALNGINVSENPGSLNLDSVNLGSGNQGSGYK